MDDNYLIWSNEHHAWWRPESRGYTLDVDGAGRYTREETISICAHARDGWGSKSVPSEIPVSEKDVQECKAEFERLFVKASA